MKKRILGFVSVLMITVLCGCNSQPAKQDTESKTVTGDGVVTQTPIPTQQEDETNEKETNKDEITTEVSSEVTQLPETTVSEDDGTIQQDRIQHGEQITEQTFEMDLYGWGNVTFASYQPIDELHDVTFSLLLGGETYQDLDDNDKNGLLEKQKFVEVSAISFKDCNEDGIKDIIAIIRYENKETKEQWDEARMYIQSETTLDFTRDVLLEEYLIKQHATSRIDTIMECVQKYPEYQLSLLTEEEKKQLELIADHVDEWTDLLLCAYNGLYYTVTDIDQNGRLELIATICEGSGFYSSNCYYEVNESLDDLVLCENTHEEGDSEEDLASQRVPVFFDESTHRYRYIFDDLIRIDAKSHYWGKEAVSLNEGKVIIEHIASSGQFYEDEDTYVIDYCDANGNEISEQEFQSMEQKMYQNHRMGTALFEWKHIPYQEEYQKMNHERLLRELVDSKLKFQLEWN